MIKQILMGAAIAVALASTPVHAESLDMQGTSGFESTNAPRRGMTMQRVESTWGQPQRRRAAVGQPPITRWEYNGFVVYFEHDRVIHTVAGR